MYRAQNFLKEESAVEKKIDPANKGENFLRIWVKTQNR